MQVAVLAERSLRAAITFSLSHPNVVATYHHDIKPLRSSRAAVGSGHWQEGRSGAIPAKFCVILFRFGSC
jgi:hypothetical protein